MGQGRASASLGSDGMSSGQVQSSRLGDAELRAIRLHVVSESGLESFAWDGSQGEGRGPRLEAQFTDCIREEEAES